MNFFRLLIIALIIAGCSGKNAEPDFVYTPLIIPQGVCTDKAYAASAAMIAKVEGYIADGNTSAARAAYDEAYNQYVADEVNHMLMAGTVDHIRLTLGEYRKEIESRANPAAIGEMNPLILETESKIEICDIHGAIKSLAMVQKLLN